MSEPTPCSRYHGSDGTVCATHHGRFAQGWRGPAHCEAEASADALDVEALAEAIYEANWLTRDPKPKQVSWRWARSQVLARKVRAILAERKP